MLKREQKCGSASGAGMPFALSDHYEQDSVFLEERSISMLPPTFTAALLLLIAGAMVVLAVLAHALIRRADTRLAVGVILVVAYGGLALAPLLFLRAYLPG